MKYWGDDRYVELRDIFDNNFNSAITVPAMKGKVLSVVNGENTTLSLYEFEIQKTPATLTKRIDPITNDEVEDLCVVFEYRLSHPNGLAGVVNTTEAPLPISEISPELLKILTDNNIIKQ